MRGTGIQAWSDQRTEVASQTGHTVTTVKRKWDSGQTSSTCFLAPTLIIPKNRGALLPLTPGDPTALPHLALAALSLP